MFDFNSSWTTQLLLGGSVLAVWAMYRLLYGRPNEQKSILMPRLFKARLAFPEAYQELKRHLESELSNMGKISGNSLKVFSVKFMESFFTFLGLMIGLNRRILAEKSLKQRKMHLKSDPDRYANEVLDFLYHDEDIAIQDEAILREHFKLAQISLDQAEEHHETIMPGFRQKVIAIVEAAEKKAMKMDPLKNIPFLKDLIIRTKCESQHDKLKVIAAAKNELANLPKFHLAKLSPELKIKLLLVACQDAVSDLFGADSLFWLIHGDQSVPEAQPLMTAIKNLISVSKAAETQ